MRVLILLALLGAAIALPKNSQRITGGSPTTVESYPFMSNMQYTVSGIVWYHNCGGSLITANTVLSAAHCFFGDLPSVWRVRLGSSFASSGGTVHNVRQLVLHPQYNSRTVDNDVAIVRLATSATFSASVGVASIAGPNYNLADGTAVTGIGWGDVIIGAPPPEQLQRVDINIISQSYCAANYAWLKAQPGFERYPEVTDNMLCAGIQHVGGKDVCKGDSGGPLLHNSNVIVGITSWSFLCAEPEFPHVFARVSRYTDWITSTA